MKNLYKIQDELYVVSNNVDISENCWIITNCKLVQVSYLLSDEVAKGFKVILTTNKLLIKDGVQKIDDEFLEWFVKNPSCEEVEVDTRPKVSSHFEKGFVIDNPNYMKIIIPKEEAKHQQEISYSEEELKSYGEFCVSTFLGIESVTLSDVYLEQFKKK